MDAFFTSEPSLGSSNGDNINRLIDLITLFTPPPPPVTVLPRLRVWFSTSFGRRSALGARNDDNTDQAFGPYF